MKTISIFKRWASMSLLFLGISLMVYADTPRVVISNVIVENVTANSADFRVAFTGATKVRLLKSYTPEEGSFQCFYTDESPNLGFNYMSYAVSGFSPNTLYYIKIEVIGLPDPNNPGVENKVSNIVSFQTEPEPEL